MIDRLIIRQEKCRNRFQVLRTVRALPAERSTGRPAQVPVGWRLPPRPVTGLMRSLMMPGQFRRLRHGTGGRFDVTDGHLTKHDRAMSEKVGGLTDPPAVAETDRAFFGRPRPSQNEFKRMALAGSVVVMVTIPRFDG